MTWDVTLHAEFGKEFEKLDQQVQDALLNRIRDLKREGPQLKRPHADTLTGSRHTNMKELRLDANGGVWRFAFAFDPARRAVILCGGDKTGYGNEKRFYKSLIKKADMRFDHYLAQLSSGTKIRNLPKGWKK